VDVTEFLKHECEIPADGFILAPNNVHQTREEDVDEDDDLDANEANEAEEDEEEGENALGEEEVSDGGLGEESTTSTPSEGGIVTENGDGV